MNCMKEICSSNIVYKKMYAKKSDIDKKEFALRLD